VLNVYLVEDDPLVSQHVRNALNEAPGVRCIGHASRLATARSELPQCRPDVLVSDIEMPNQDGYSLIRRIRALEIEAISPLEALNTLAELKSILLGRQDE